MANNSQTWKKAEAQKIDNSRKRMSMSTTTMIGHPSSWSHSIEDVNMGTSPPSVGNENIPMNYHLFSKSLESGRSFMSLFASSKHNGTKDLGTSPPKDAGIYRVDDKELLHFEGLDEESSENDAPQPKNSFIDVPPNSAPRRKRLVSSGATLNYLRTSNNIGPVQYHKWTPFNPTNNSLILFDDLTTEPSSDVPPLHSLIVKDLVPAGFTVYSIIGGKLFSRDDIHRFIKSVISMKSHLFVYCKSLSSLVVLDYVLRHQGNIKGIILSQPVITLYESKSPSSSTGSLTRKLVKSLAPQNTFHDELTKLSRYVTKNLEKLSLPTLFLQISDMDSYNTNMKLYQLLTSEKQMMIYPSSFNERVASSRSKLKNDIKQWLLQHYCTFQESFIGKSNWSLLPQEIKTFIFSLLDTKTLCRVSIVSKSWRNLTSISLEEIDLNSRNYDNRIYIRYIASFPFLKRLNLEGWAGITDKDVEYISERCQVLHSLNLSGCWKITDDSLYALSENCLHLRQLNIRSCPKITNDGLIILAKSCKYLSSLNLSKCTRIDSLGLYELALLCKNLVELDLSYFKIGRIQAGLKHFSQLEILYLEGRQLRTSDDEDNDDSTAHLEEVFEKLPNLRILSLKGSSKVTPAVKANIAKYCTKLESLFV